MSSYIVFLANAPVSFKVGLQGLTAQSSMEAELVAAERAMKKALICFNMMKELGFGTRFESVAPYTDNTSALHVTVRERVALRYFFIEQLVKEGSITVKICENRGPAC